MKGSLFLNPIRDENPCYNCQRPERCATCHGTCKDHAKWKAEVERVNKNRREYARQKELGWRKK